MPSITGGCLCGKVRYSANAEPIFVGLCHCHDCQKFTGTTFHFVTDGITSALAQAKAAAADKDVKIGGGVSTVRQYLQAGLIDELHFAIAPVVLGRGEAMFNGIDLPALGFRVTERAASALATHVVLARA